MRPRLLFDAGARLTLASSYAAQGLTVVTGLLLARALGPDDRGVVAAAVIVPTFLMSILHFGISEALVVRLAASRDPAQQAPWLAAAALMAVQAVAVVLAVQLLGPLLLTAEEAGLAQVLLAYVPLTLLTALCTSTLLAQSRLRRWNAVRLAAQVLLAAAFGVLVLLEAMTPMTVVLTYVATEAVVAAVALVSVRVGQLLRPLPSVRGVIASGRSLVHFGVRAHASSLSTLANERGDQLLLAALVPPAELGRYVVAVSLSAPVALVGGALGPLAMGRAAARTGEADAGRTAYELMLRTVVLSSGLCVLVVVLAQPAVELLLRDRYPNLAPMVRVLALASVGLSLTRLQAGLLKGLGRPLAAGACELCALAVALAVLLPLVAEQGAMAAALGALAGYSAGAVTGYALLRSHYGR